MKQIFNNKKSVILLLFLLTLNSYFIIPKLNKNYNILKYMSEFNSDNDFSLNPSHKLCYKKNIILLAMVSISIDKFSTRSLIRATWSNRLLVPNLRVIFLVGSSYNMTLNDKIKEEFKLYGDIVRENFLDTYRNLTLKTIMGIRWASKYCENAKYIMKLDDNILLNSYNLVKFLEKKVFRKNTFLCKTWQNAAVRRDNTSKFFIPKDVYKFDHYPTCKSIIFIKIIIIY
jgi:hypothetical protein